LSGSRLFGTDGVRGIANVDLTPGFALQIATATIGVLRSRGTPERPTVVVGRDTRASGEMLEAAVVAGLTSAGADVLLTGVLPTPGVAYLVDSLGADLGVVLSASHNPMPDNGIKFFGPGGRKLADETEAEIERRLYEEWDRPFGADVGRVSTLPDAASRYVEHLLGLSVEPLTGLRVVVDAAHGSASYLAPDVYRKAGAEVIAIGCEPTGLNINDGVGSTHLEPLRRAVLEHHADLGIAHDGDADRCLAVAADGTIVDGDAILAICALGMHARGELAHDTVVTTVMTNLGFTRAMAEAGISVVQTAVGDRYVLEAMNEHSLVLGGEQSGHVVFKRHATTGDGMLTALQLMGWITRTGTPLAKLAAVVQRMPQVLVNVQVRDRRIASYPEVAAAVRAAEARLGSSGRVLLRPSGTEPLVRVMVEASTQADADECAQIVADAVRQAAGS